MFKKRLLLVSIVAALALAGCYGDDSNPTSGVNIQQGVALFPATVSVVEAK